MNKLPPIEKVYEAYSAIADGRITLFDGYAKVFSSSGKTEYTVTWDDNNTYAADDNGTYWQGYPGYPIIAVLMLQQKLPFQKTTADYFKNIPWSKLNKLVKNDYSKALQLVFDDLGLDAQAQENIKAQGQKVYTALKDLDITTKRYRKSRAANHTKKD